MNSFEFEKNLRNSEILQEVLRLAEKVPNDVIPLQGTERQVNTAGFLRNDFVAERWDGGVNLPRLKPEHKNAAMASAIIQVINNHPAASWWLDNCATVFRLLSKEISQYYPPKGEH